MNGENVTELGFGVQVGTNKRPILEVAIGISHPAHSNALLDVSDKLPQLCEVGIDGDAIFPFIFGPLFSECVDIDISWKNEVHEIDINFFCD